MTKLPSSVQSLKPGPGRPAVTWKHSKLWAHSSTVLHTASPEGRDSLEKTDLGMKRKAKSEGSMERLCCRGYGGEGSSEAK